jgi:hypothetical protein
MNTRGKRAKCEGTKIMNPLDAVSTKDMPRERTTKSFLYSNFIDHQKGK